MTAKFFMFLCPYVFFNRELRECGRNSKIRKFVTTIVTTANDREIFLFLCLF